MTASRGTVLIPAAQSIAKASELAPVIGYARVSTWREEMISIDIQKSVVEEAAARRGRYVAEWIIDPDATGRNFKRRVMHGIEIIEDPGRPERELWSWKFSRFGRNRHGVAINLARIENAGGQLISATEDVDASTAVGEFTRDMLFAVAAFESNRAGEQWRETHELRRSAGLPATGRKRFGYRWHPRRVPDSEGGWKVQDEWYEVLPDKAEIIHDSYTRYIAGKTGYHRLATWWNDLGLRNTWDHPWQDQTVRTFMIGGFSAGLLHVHRQDIACPRRSDHCLDSEHWYYRPAEHEAIIDGDEWDSFTERRQERSRTPRRSLSPVYPLSGLVFCGVCREEKREARCNITHNGSRPDLTYYLCGANRRGLASHGRVRVRSRVVEEEVRGWLEDVRAEIDAIIAGHVVIPQQRIDRGDTEHKRKQLAAQIEKLTRALNRAAEAYALGDLPRDTFLNTRDKLTADRQARQQEFDALPDPDEAPASPVPHREVVVGLLADWDTISVQSKRVTLGTLVRRVDLGLDRAVSVVPVWAPPDEPLPVVKGSRRRLS
ncbi:recombinase family protein [Streptomyces sp. NPDC058319]|uniref:recombinase family protein n=1 Tax=unclassified Streptomyces TaxID=2593676 RepID=UPI0036EEC7AF